MSVEENKQTVRDYFEAFLSKDFAWMDEHIAPDFVRNDPGLPFEVRGPDGVKKLADVLLDAFPDMSLDFEDLIGEGDKVMMRLTLHATHEGEFAGLAPTGRKVKVAVLDLFHVVGGRLEEHWALLDNMGLMRQLS